MSNLDKEKSIVPAAYWKPRILVIGAVIGAVVGALAAYLLVQNADEEAPPQMTPGKGVKLGLMVFSLLKSISLLKE